MKRILVFGLSEYYGGVESFFLNYLKFKRNNDLVFDFVPENYKLVRENEFKKMGCYVYNVANWRKNPIRYKKQIKKILNENKYDVVYMNLLSAYNLMPLKIAKKLNIPLRIIHSHNSFAPNNTIKLLIHKYNRKKIQNLTTNNYACSELAGKWMFNDNNYEIITNAIDAYKFKFNRETRKKKQKELDLSDKDFVIGFVGRLSYQKNPLFLIDIFKEVVNKNSNAKLVIVGDGELKEAVITRITKLELNDKIHLLGNRNDINELMQTFDAFLLPSYFEGLAIVLVEAQFSGLHCVISDTITREANISGSVSYLPLSNNSKIWANELLNINFDYDNRYKIINSCKKEFDLKVSANSFFETIYNSILRGGVE